MAVSCASAPAQGLQQLELSSTCNDAHDRCSMMCNTFAHQAGSRLLPSQDDKINAYSLCMAQNMTLHALLPHGLVRTVSGCTDIAQPSG